MKPEVIVVLGNESHGGKLSLLGIERVEKCIEVYEKENVGIILSGGYSLKKKVGEGPTEAELMKGYLVDKGVREEDILLEEDSRDTVGNAFFSKKIILENGWKNLIVVTSDVHEEKARFAFNLVFGPEFSISFELSKSDMDAGDFEELKKSQGRSTGWLKNFYEEKGVERGEDTRILECLMELYDKFGR